MGFEFDAERAAGFGLEDGKQRTGLGEGEISSFSAGDRASSWFRTARSCIRALSRSLIDVQDMASHISGKLAVLASRKRARIDTSFLRSGELWPYSYCVPYAL